MVRDFAREREKMAPTMGAAAAVFEGGGHHSSQLATVLSSSQNGADAATLLSSSSDLLRRRRWWAAAVSNDAMDVSAVGNGDGLFLSPELVNTGAVSSRWWLVGDCCGVRGWYPEDSLELEHGGMEEYFYNDGSRGGGSGGPEGERRRGCGGGGRGDGAAASWRFGSGVTRQQLRPEVIYDDGDGKAPVMA